MYDFRFDSYWQRSWWRNQWKAVEESEFSQSKSWKESCSLCRCHWWFVSTSCTALVPQWFRRSSWWWNYEPGGLFWKCSSDTPSCWSAQNNASKGINVRWKWRRIESVVSWIVSLVSGCIEWRRHPLSTLSSTSISRQSFIIFVQLVACVIVV